MLSFGVFGLSTSRVARSVPIVAAGALAVEEPVERTMQLSRTFPIHSGHGMTIILW